SNHPKKPPKSRRLRRFFSRLLLPEPFSGRGKRLARFEGMVFGKGLGEPLGRLPDRSRATRRGLGDSGLFGENLVKGEEFREGAPGAGCLSPGISSQRPQDQEADGHARQKFFHYAVLLQKGGPGETEWKPERGVRIRSAGPLSRPKA